METAVSELCCGDGAVEKEKVTVVKSLTQSLASRVLFCAYNVRDRLSDDSEKEGIV